MLTLRQVFGHSAMAQVAPPGNGWWAGSAPPQQPAPAMGPLQAPNSGCGAAVEKGKGLGQDFVLNLERMICNAVSK